MVIVAGVCFVFKETPTSQDLLFHPKPNFIFFQDGNSPFSATHSATYHTSHRHLFVDIYQLLRATYMAETKDSQSSLIMARRFQAAYGIVRPPSPYTTRPVAINITPVISLNSQLMTSSGQLRDKVWAWWGEYR
jgi:hypothetical protein